MKDVNLTQQLKHYFGFDSFKGDRKPLYVMFLQVKIRLC